MADEKAAMKTSAWARLECFLLIMNTIKTLLFHHRSGRLHLKALQVREAGLSIFNRIYSLKMDSTAKLGFKKGSNKKQGFILSTRPKLLMLTMTIRTSSTAKTYTNTNKTLTPTKCKTGSPSPIFSKTILTFRCRKIILFFLTDQAREWTSKCSTHLSSVNISLCRHITELKRIFLNRCASRKA